MKLLNLIFFMFLSLSFLTAQCDRERDSLALVSLYNSTDGPNWTIRWDLSQPIDSWYGITTNNAGCVVCVDLDGYHECSNGGNPNGVPNEGNNLNGPLPKQFFSLSQVEKIILRKNSLSSEIPPEIDDLQDLEFLDLSDNELFGDIPNFGSLVSLEAIILRRNNITGNIPASIGLCSNLKTIDFALNSMTGEIPSEIGDLVGLRNLSLNNNKTIEGYIPQTFSNLESLRILNIYDNSLEGQIPLFIGSLKELVILHLGANLFSGSVPDTITTLLKLQEARLDKCQFTGDIPNGFGSLVDLTRLRLNNNKLSGCVPQDFDEICDMGYAASFFADGYDFTNNPCLPWQGDLQQFCNGESQIGAPVDDGNPNTTNDVLGSNCECGAVVTEICDNGIDDDGDGDIDCEDSDCFSYECIQCLQDSISFADYVIEYSPQCENITNNNDLGALGIADYTTPFAGNDVSLGEGGFIKLGFNNNSLINSGNDSPDLWVFEVGALVEPMSISLRPLNVTTVDILLSEGINDSNSDGFYEFGDIGGSTSSIDIDKFIANNYVEGSLIFDAVMLIDIVDADCLNNTNGALGADIDAVCALSSISNLVEICDNGIDDDGDGLVDCEDPDVAGLICCQTDLCNDAVDIDGDGVGDACDQDDDNDGIIDAFECPPVFLSTSGIQEWLPLTGGNEIDVQVGDVFIAEEHYTALDGSIYDLRFELLEKYSDDSIADYAAKIRTSTGSIGVCMDGGIPAQNDHIVYDLSWVESGSATTTNLTGSPASFDWARITISDIDNNSPFFIDAAGDTTYLDPNFTDVGGFANTIYNFEYGDLLQSYVLPNGREVFGVSEPSLDQSNCPGCSISGEMLPFTNASLIHGVVGIRAGRTNRQAQWSFRLGDCRDTDGDGIPDYRDLDSDDDSCVDAIEGSGDYGFSDVLVGMLVGGVDSITGVPILAPTGQFLGTSILASLQDPDCNVDEICDNGFDDDGDGFVDCDDPDLSEDCCCLDVEDVDLVDSFYQLCEGDELLIAISEDYNNIQVISDSIGSEVINNNIIITEAGSYEVNAIDSCQNIVSDTFLVEFYVEDNLLDSTAMLCEGDVYSFQGQSFSDAGIYEIMQTSNNGCDYIFTLEIIVIEALETYEEYTIYTGETIDINGTVYSSEGIYQQTLISSMGCDSIITIDVIEIKSIAFYDMDDCNATITNHNFLYDEFTATYPDVLSCTEISASNLYRENPTVNVHSCTPGIDNSSAVCISSHDDCAYEAGNEKAMNFEITVDDDTDQHIELNRITFHQMSPVEFDWINGASGLNNYPTQYGIRVLVDEVEVFRSVDIATSVDWSMEQIDISDVIVMGGSKVRFELLAYCLIGNGSPVSAWDLENINVFGSCIRATEDIQGRLTTWNDTSIPEVGMILKYGDIRESVMTDAQGGYAFSNIYYGEDYEVKPFNDENCMQGVSTLDLVLIQKHILGIKPFDQVGQFIASDINNSNSISAIDLIELRKLILGVHDCFEDNTSWRFYDSSQEISIDDPWNMEEVIDVQQLSDFHKSNDFTGVKIGDVNGSIENTLLDSRHGNLSNWSLLPNTQNTEDGIYSFGIQISEELEIAAFQISIDLGNYILQDVQGKFLDIATQHYAIDGNILTLSWSNIDVVLAQKGDVLFDIEVKLEDKQIVRDIEINSKFNNEVYLGEELVTKNISLRTGNASSIDDMEVQIAPNPFSDFINLMITSDTEDKMDLNVYDLSGRIIYSTSLFINKGDQNLLIESPKNLISGQALILELTTPTDHIIKKMVKAF